MVYAIINITFHPTASFINIGTALVNIINILFIIKKKPIIAFDLLLISNALVGLSLVILFGKYIAADLLFCVGIIYAIAMYNKWERIGFGVSINIILYLISLYIYESYTPYYKDVQDLTMVFYYPNAIVFLITLFGLAFILKNENQQFEKDLVKANHKNEVLLHQMLPKDVADELKVHGEVEPRIYSNVTVMFTDFYEFTKIAEKLTAIKLVKDLDDYFTVFDRIIEKYNLEKLKTIGDAYMCVSGLPIQRDDHAIIMLKAAIEIRNAVEAMYTERTSQGLEAWHIRIGIHSGTVVAGIIGESKFAYDIWGDTVNTAARMESSSEPGKINISETTYDLVKNSFKTTYRGKIQAKNKGELNMYFADSLNN